MFCFVSISFWLLFCQATLVSASSINRDYIEKVHNVRHLVRKNLDNYVNFAKSVHKRSVMNQTEEEKSVAEKLINRCSACILLVSVEKKRMEDDPKTSDFKSALKWIERGCIYFDIEAPKVCSGANSIFGDEVADVFSKVKLLPEQICGISLPDVCTSFHHISAINEPWSVSIPKTLIQTSKTYQKPVSSMKVLHLSDVHIDMQYVVGSNAECDEPVCCRQPIPKKKPSFIESMEKEFIPQQPHENDFPFEKQAMKWGDYRNCDLPYWTFEDLLKQLSEKNKPKQSPIDYILFTGDLPAHDVWAQTKSQQTEMIFNISATILKYFPNTPVYPAIGNHDSFPANSFPPNDLNVDAKFKIDWLYKAFADAWKPWLTEQALQTVRRAGFYSVLVKPGFRIVSLNTNFCYTANMWLWMEQKDPDHMLRWFVDVLTIAEANHELVHVIGHVPPGRQPECLKIWSENYFKIIERFSNTVIAQFFGHTHYDELQLFYDVTGNPVSVSYVTPSLTPYTGMKPSFRFFDIENFSENSGWRVLNHQTFVLNLITSNDTDLPTWEREYDACEAFNLTYLSPNSWNSMVSEWLSYLSGNETTTRSVSSALNKYVDFYLKLHPLVEGGQPVISGYTSKSFIFNLVCDIFNNLSPEVCQQSDEQPKAEEV